MNHIQQDFIQKIMKQQQQERQQQVKQEENGQKQNIQYLQKQQLLSIIQKCQQQQQPIQQATKFPSLIEVQNQVTSYFQQIILQKQIININNVFDQQLPYFLQIMGNLIVYGLENSPGDKEIVQEIIKWFNKIFQKVLLLIYFDIAIPIPFYYDFEDKHIIKLSSGVAQYKSNPLKITMSCSLFQTIGLLFRSQLVYYDQCTKYLSNFLLFRDEFCDIFFNTLYSYQITHGQTFSQQIGFTQIHQMILKTQEDVWTAFIFKMMSQQQQKMTKEMFLLQFNQYTVSMNNFFAKSNLIMDLVGQSVKQISKLHNDQIFQEFLLIMGSFKATTQDFLKKATQVFFEESNDLDLLQFSSNIIKVHKQMNCQILFILPMLFQLESQYLDHLVQNGIQDQQPVKNSSNYYLKMIEKLKNKCVYNGEEECNCKKCQCIRRNRNSAKESQKKKREALEKIGPLQDEYDKIKKKVQSLEKENQVITKLLLDVFRHPSLEKLASQFIEPLTKIIADQDFYNIDEC